LAILQTAAYIIAIITALLITPAASRSFSFQLDIGKMRSMIRATWPYALLILLMTAYNKLDGVMLERLAQDGLVEAGIYAQAYRIIDAGNSFAFLYAGMLLPIFSRLISTNKSDDLRNMIDQGARFLVIPAGLASVLMVYKAEWFMDLLYTSSVVESANAFQWLMGSFLFICMGYVFGTYLTASNQLAAMNWIAFAAVIVNITLNVALIPNLGAHGAALASFSSLLIMALAQIVLVYRSVSIRLFQWFWRGLVCWISLAITGYAINQVNLSDLSAIGLLIAAAIVLYVLIGLRRSDLKTAIPS
jgi:O-antigen/teichoic acid export membrane protein